MINMIVDCCSCCHEDADLCPNEAPVTYEVEVIPDDPPRIDRLGA